MRRAIGIVCDACGKQFATSDGFDQHRTSGYLIGTPCHVLDDRSTSTHLVSSERATMSTAMLQKLKMDRRKHCTARALLILLMTVYFTYFTYVYLWNKNRAPPCTAPPVLTPTVLIKLIWLIIFFVSSTVTYATYDGLLMLLMIYLWFTYDLLMKWGRGVYLSYLWKLPSTYFTYEYLCLLMLLILLMTSTNYVLHLYYLWFT